MKKVIVIIPTYNEKDNIEPLVTQIFEVLPDAEVLIVDDNSPDGTTEKVKELQNKYKNLHLVVRTENRGRGAAGIEGFKKSVELGADIVVEMDGDLSHSPYEIPKLVKTLENTDADIVIGSRYIPGGEDSQRNVLRRIISFIARVYLKIITGIPVKDLTSGFKAYKSEVLKTILPYLKAKDPFIVTETNYFCKLFKFKFVEIPITFHQRLKGQSKLTFGKLVKYLFKVWGLVWRCFLNDKYNLNFIKFSFLINVLRVVLVPLFGLTDDEAHYWQYSQYLDFSYYDHPPMVGYLIFLFTQLFGNNVYGVRTPAIICFTVASIYFYLLLKEQFNSKIAFYTTLLLNFIPIFFVGSIVTIPDAPLGMFWMMYLFYFYKFVKTNDSWYLYLSGVILGLAGLSKYNSVFLFISSVIFLLSYKKLRTWVLKKEFYIFCLIVITGISPVLLWNIAHNFVSFKFQFSRGIGTTPQMPIITFLQNFGSQMMYISPVVFFLLWYYIIIAWKQKRTLEENFLLIFSLPGIIVFNIIAFNNLILPHWPAISYSTLLPFLLLYHKKISQYISSLIVAVSLTLSVLIITIFGLIPVPKNLENADTPDKLYGWEIAAEELKNILDTHPELFILTHRYYVAGQIRFALANLYDKKKLTNKPIPEIYCINNYTDQYDFWGQDISNYTTKDAVFVTEGRFPVEDVLYKYPFKDYKIISTVGQRKHKLWPFRTFKFYLCKNFQYHRLSPEFRQDYYNNFTLTTEYFRNYDKKIFLKINENKFSRTKLFKYLSFGFTSLGNGWILTPLMIVVLYLINKKKFVYNLIVFFSIALTGGVIIQLLKFWFNKPRPLKLFSDILNQPINVIGEQLRELGFPSGHTFLAVAAAMFLSTRIKKWYVTNLLFIIAICVGISRICVGAHFLSDVIGGVIIGVVYTSLCLKIESEIM